MSNGGEDTPFDADLPDVPFDDVAAAEGAAPEPVAAPAAVVPPAAAAPVVVGVAEEKMPAVPLPSAPPDLADAFQTEAKGPTKKGEPPEEYFYAEEQQRFLRKNPAGRWIALSEGQFTRHLKKDYGVNDKAGGGKIISAAHEMMSHIENNRRVAYAGIIAGYQAGVHTMAGRQILVTAGPVFIEPKQGEWPILAKYFEGLFSGTEPTDDAGSVVAVDQRPYVFAWLQHALQCYYECKPYSGLALCLAGDINCGKSFFAIILSMLFGGRVANPYRFMMNDDSFNRDLIEAPLQLIDDENQADTDYKARQKFAAEIKMITANNQFRVRAMHTDPFSIPVLRRLVVLCNLHGTRLLVLPPLDGDVDDKLSLFKGYARPKPKEPITLDTPAEQACWPAPMPTRTIEERERYLKTVAAELPAFLWWLLKEWKMPSQVSGGRFVARHYHHPAIVAALHEHSPHMRFWDLLLRSKVVFATYQHGSVVDGDPEWVKREEWRGSAGELEQLLKKHNDSQLSKEERAEVKASNWLGRTLDLCAQHFGEAHCRQEKGHGGRVWVLRPRAEDQVT